MGPSANSELTYLMGFHHVTAQAAISGIHFLANESRERGNSMGKAASRILTACEWADALDGLNDR